MALEKSRASRMAHALQNSIAKGPMEDVAGAGGIHAIHHEGRRVDKLSFFERERAVGAERHGGDAHLVFALDHFQGAERIALIGPLHGELGTGDEVIDMRQHAVEAVIDGVDIHGNGNSGGARDAGGMLDGRRYRDRRYAAAGRR